MKEWLAGTKGSEGGDRVDQRNNIEPEELLAHTGWLKALARRLVDDEATADDLVQQAYVAALERPPSERHALTAWLSRVVRNLAARTHRDAMRRRQRETRVAQSENQQQVPHELIERAELQRLMMDAVLELEEPFRTTVLLRYFEDRSPEEVAKQTGVSINTVGTRLYRALGKVRQRLDREQGGRAAWIAILAPWVGLSAVGATTPAAAAITLSSEAKSGQHLRIECRQFRNSSSCHRFKRPTRRDLPHAKTHRCFDRHRSTVLHDRLWNWAEHRPE